MSKLKVHHLTCGCLCPLGGWLFDGFSSSVLGGGLLSCHCLLVETPSQGLVLVDTGFGLKDLHPSSDRVHPMFKAICRPNITADMTAVAQVKQLGFSPSDVRHIVLTHLDFDHAGGIDDFPEATIHVLASEKETAEWGDGMICKRRYRKEQFCHHTRWELYEPQGEKEQWFDFEAIKLRGLPDDILLVPLRGHTPGHCGVAVQSDKGWLLHAGDAYFYRDEMNVAKPYCTPGLRAYQWLMDSEATWRRQNQLRLRQLVKDSGDKVTVFCAHDYKEFETLRDESSPTAAAS